MTFPGSLDPTSLILLFLGKDNPWIPLCFLIMLVFQKWEQINKFYKDFKLFGKVQYKVTCVFYTNIEESYTYGDLSSSTWALLRYINNLTKSNKTLLSNAISINMPYNDVFDDKTNVVVIPGNNSTIKLTNDISCTIELRYQSRESTKADKPCIIDSTTLTFILNTPTSFHTITQFMTKIINEHCKIVESKHSLNKYIIKPLYSKRLSDIDMTELSHPEMIKFQTTKSFDNLFFDGKEELMNRLNSFANREKYKVLGLPETLGLLFYGAPGTGKTSCIKAIAQYLDMSIIIVPMNKIKTKKRLEELFFSTRINTPQNKRIYVFEEIDCNGWENIVRDRSLIKEDNCDNDNASENSIVDKITDVLKPHHNKNKKEEEDKLTLGGILEVIDGLIECPGRIIIMTTNHKEHLDSALLRPGRIDMEIEFKKLRNSHIAEIYKKWYGHDLEEYKAQEIDDYKYTQAEISQLLFKYKDNPDRFISEVTS
jgi:chaperone BCS1